MAIFPFLQYCNTFFLQNCSFQEVFSFSHIAGKLLLSYRMEISATEHRLRNSKPEGLSRVKCCAPAFGERTGTWIQTRIRSVFFPESYVYQKAIFFLLNEFLVTIQLCNCNHRLIMIHKRREE